MSTGDKGNFKTDLPKDILDAALDAVRKRENPGVEVEMQQPSEASSPAEAEGSASGAGSEEVEQLKLQLDASQAKGRELMGKIKDEHEKMLRAVADLENYKKRANKEKEEMQKFGNEKLLRDLLPVVDNIDRGLDASNVADLDSLKKGMEMIRKLFEDTLAKHGVKAFTSKGKPFDPNFHEAMSQAETDDMPPNHVHSEILRGFMLNDRLVRPGLVVVSKAKTPAAATPPADSTPTGEGSNG